MGEPLRVMWSEGFLGYDFGAGHVFRSVRLRLTMHLARQLGVLDRAGVELASAPAATDEQLQTVHHPDYIDAVRHAGHQYRRDVGYGLGTPDNPVFDEMHEASALVVGATIDAANAVWEGRTRHAVNLAGGLHHAMPGFASGFCVYNDIAVAIKGLLAAGAQRIAYVDVDVHHGDGVQAVFYDDPRVLTISLHQDPHQFFPGTGRPSESGGPHAEGYSVNVALPAGTGDAGWLRAFGSVVPPLLRSFEPEILVTQQGCDSHAFDPLASLELSVDGQHASYTALHQLAHELCDGRWVAVGGGGYAHAAVVPRAWTRLLAEASGDPIAPATETPEAWRDEVIKLGLNPPELMGDAPLPEIRSWESGYDPAEPIDRAITATRRAIFPFHGLDPV